jgi:hypothetical protein
LTDIHYREAVPGTSPIAKRECRRMGEVLDRCLEYLTAARVELVICAGDCVDDPSHPAVPEDLASLRDRFTATGLPFIMLPGNHDPAPEVFYQTVPRPPRVWRPGRPGPPGRRPRTRRSRPAHRPRHRPARW